MKSFVTVILLLQLWLNRLEALPIDDYWTRRAELLRAEEYIALGGNLSFEDGERIANDLLMSLKRKEIDEGFENLDEFAPTKNFLKVRDKIESSEVFKIIKQLPKGAVLHAHDTAFVSEDFIYHNITYRDNLHICNDNGTLEAYFFKDSPPFICDWQLLSDLRKNSTTDNDINNIIRQKLSMITNDPDTEYPDVNSAWTKFMDIFMFITPMLTYRPVYEDHFYHGLKELYEDNIMYLELRSTLPPLYELNGTTYNPLEVIGIYQQVTKRFINDYPDFIGVKIIFAPIRYMNSREMDNYVHLALEMTRIYPDFFAGIDLVGQEDKLQPLTMYADRLQLIANNVSTFFHAGETDWYGLASDENLIDAVLLNTKRIGHGYALLKHPLILKIVKEKNIAVEICPISNQVLGLVKDLRNHPASVLFAEGFPVVVSNDDPGLLGSRALSYDFYEAFVGMMSKKADIRALKQLAKNSIIHSTMNDNEKRRALTLWKTKWTEFINRVNYFEKNDFIVNYT